MVLSGTLGVGGWGDAAWLAAVAVAMCTLDYAGSCATAAFATTVFNEAVAASTHKHSQHYHQ